MKYETARGDEVGVYEMDRFYVDMDTGSGVSRTRAELTELRHIIDQALNTSAEELNDDVA